MSAFGAPRVPKEWGSERSDAYGGVVCIINDRWRVIVCKNNIQWILQKSKADGGHGRAWRGVSHLTTKKALIEACARLCGLYEPEVHVALDGLPERFPVNQRGTS